MFSLVARNRIKSMVIMTIMVTLLTVMGGVAAGSYDTNAAGSGALAGLGLAALMALFSYFQGSSLLLKSAGAQPVSAQSHPLLVNVVEEMVIASGLGVTPEIYVIDSADFNAFATGRSPAHSAIAVTRGLLGILNRDELQGVVAHELSHIKHRDVLFMTLLMALTNAIGIIADYQIRAASMGGGRSSSRRDSNDSSDDNKGSSNGSAALWWLLRIAVFIFGAFIARLLFLFASRTREYMADASGAIFTRNPGALASALEKLAAQQDTQPAQLPKSVQAILTVQQDLGSTHPPLAKRIAILRRLAGTSNPTYGDYATVYRSVTGSRPGFIPKAMRSEQPATA